jgi:hypothetical protein
MLWYTFPDGYSGMRGTVHFLNGKPVIGGRVSLWGNSNDTSTDANGFLQHGDMLDVDPLAKYMRESVLPQPGARDPTSANGYSLIPVNAWSHNVSDVLRTANLLNSGGLTAPSAVIDLGLHLY